MTSWKITEQVAPVKSCCHTTSMILCNYWQFMQNILVPKWSDKSNAQCMTHKQNAKGKVKQQTLTLSSKNVTLPCCAQAIWYTFGHLGRKQPAVAPGLWQITHSIEAPRLHAESTYIRAPFIVSYTSFDHSAQLRWTHLSASKFRSLVNIPANNAESHCNTWSTSNKQWRNTHRTNTHKCQLLQMQ